MTNNIYVISENEILNSNVSDSLSEKLRALKVQLKIYAQRYENELRNQGIEESKIKEMADAWISAIYRFYQMSEDDLTPVINHFTKLNTFGIDSEEKLYMTKTK